MFAQDCPAYIRALHALCRPLVLALTCDFVPITINSKSCPSTFSRATPSVIMATNAPDGSYQRPASQFRSTIEKGGQFPPERDRYHLYVSYSCRTWSQHLRASRLVADTHTRISSLGNSDPHRAQAQGARGYHLYAASTCGVIRAHLTTNLQPSLLLSLVSESKAGHFTTKPTSTPPILAPSRTRSMGHRTSRTSTSGLNPTTTVVSPFLSCGTRSSTR